MSIFHEANRDISSHRMYLGTTSAMHSLTRSSQLRPGSQVQEKPSCQKERGVETVWWGTCGWAEILYEEEQLEGDVLWSMISTSIPCVRLASATLVICILNLNSRSRGHQLWRPGQRLKYTGAFSEPFVAHTPWIHHPNPSWTGSLPHRALRKARKFSYIQMAKDIIFICKSLAYYSGPTSSVC